MLPPTIEQPVSNRIASIFNTDTQDSPVLIAHGYGIRVGVWNGHLEIHDGIGRHRRTRKIAKADRIVKRLIITGQEGYVTLQALRWCQDHGLPVTVLDRDGQLVTQYGQDQRPADSVRLARRQALATADGPLASKVLEVTRELLTIKLQGQASNSIKLLDDPVCARRIDVYADEMKSATELHELNDLERWAAKAYFDTWIGRVAVPFEESELSLIPGNWRTFPRRKLSASSENTRRYATDPVNAMLNYAYTIGYTESRIACYGHGLDARLGFNHADSDKRDSLALDLLETIRPDIDAYILGLLGFGSEPRIFTRKDFHEPKSGYPHGTCRLVAPLTHEIAAQSLEWETPLSEAASLIVRILTGAAGKLGGKSMALKDQRTEFVSRAVDVVTILPDKDWAWLQALLPPRAPQDYSSISNRTILAAFIHLERYGKPLAHIPQGFGVSRRTMAHRRTDWSRSGHWPEIERAIQDLAARPE